MKSREVLDSCKEQIQIHIETLLQLGVRKANIEIELIHHIKNLLKKD